MGKADQFLNFPFRIISFHTAVTAVCVDCDDGVGRGNLRRKAELPCARCSKELHASVPTRYSSAYAFRRSFIPYAVRTLTFSPLFAWGVPVCCLVLYLCCASKKKRHMCKRRPSYTAMFSREETTASWFHSRLAAMQ